MRCGLCSSGMSRRTIPVVNKLIGVARCDGRHQSCGAQDTESLVMYQAWSLDRKNWCACGVCDAAANDRVEISGSFAGHVVAAKKTRIVRCGFCLSE